VLKVTPLSVSVDQADVINMLVNEHGANIDLGHNGVDFDGILPTISHEYVGLSNELYCSLHDQDNFVEIAPPDPVPPSISWILLQNRHCLKPNLPSLLSNRILEFASLVLIFNQNEHHELASTLIKSIAAYCHESACWVFLQHGFAEILTALVYCITNRLHDDKISAIESLVAILRFENNTDVINVNQAYGFNESLLAPYLSEIISLLHVERGPVCSILMDFVRFLLTKTDAAVQRALREYYHLPKLINAHKRSKLHCVRKSAKKLLCEMSKLDHFHDDVSTLSRDVSQAAAIDRK